MASVWIEGIEELNTLAVDLGNAGPKVQARAKLVVSKSSLDTKSDGQAFCPVDTGNLKNSIGVDTDSDGLGASIGPSANYGIFVEYGTSRMAPSAFMGPAFDRQSGLFEQAMAALTEEVLR